MALRRQLPTPNSQLPRTLWKLGVGSWVLILSVSGCGKKGPPLAPFVRVPAAVGQLAAHRVGDDVIINLALPTQNIDKSTPISLGRVEVYAYTGRSAPPAARFPEVADRVATIETTAETPPAAALRETLTRGQAGRRPSAHEHCSFAADRQTGSRRFARRSQAVLHGGPVQRSRPIGPAKFDCRASADAAPRCARRCACHLHRRRGDAALGSVRRDSGFSAGRSAAAIGVSPGRRATDRCARHASGGTDSIQRVSQDRDTCTDATNGGSVEDAGTDTGADAGESGASRWLHVR